MTTWKPERTTSPTVRGLPVAPADPWITRAELAKIMGVSVRTIDKLVADGMPSVTWGLRTRRFKASTAVAWAQARVRE